MNPIFYISLYISISFLRIPNKIYSEILEKRIRGRVEGLLQEELYSYRETHNSPRPYFYYATDLWKSFVDLTKKVFDQVRKTDISEALMSFAEIVKISLVNRNKIYFNHLLSLLSVLLFHNRRSNRTASNKWLNVALWTASSRRRHKA